MTHDEILSEELAILIDDITRAHIAAGQKASGQTIGSLSYRVEGGTHGIVEGASYIGVLDKGRKAGKVPQNMRDIILKWATAKGISFSSKADANRFAYFVCKKIREKGTQLYRDGGRTDILEEPIEQFTERLAKRLAGLYTQQIINSIFTPK